MNEMMNFPETWEEYEKLYGFNDSEEIYTNNSRLIPSFRVKQWLDHIAQKETKRQAIKVSDYISRQAAIDAPVKMVSEGLDWIPVYHLKDLPSAEPEKAKRGFWYTIEKGDKGYSAGDFRCSVCNEPNHTWIPKPNYCSNCGADMRWYEEDE